MENEISVQENITVQEPSVETQTPRSIDGMEVINFNLFTLALDNKLADFLGNYTIEQLEEFIEKTDYDDFGTTGVYAYYCKKCGRAWNFKTKEDKCFFERLHNIIGCALEYHISSANALYIKRSNENISKTAKDKIEMLIDERLGKRNLNEAA